MAVTRLSPSTVRTQAPVPVQPPLQPLKTEPVFAVAVAVTTVPYPYVPPGGSSLTAPLPAPAVAVLTVYWLRLKWATSVRLAVAVKMYLA